MLQPGRGRDLAQEALGAQLDGQAGLQHLQRDGPLEPELTGEVHRGHPAPADDTFDHVAVFQRLEERAAGRGPNGLRGGRHPDYVAAVTAAAIRASCRRCTRSWPAYIRIRWSTLSSPRSA